MCMEASRPSAEGIRQPQPFIGWQACEVHDWSDFDSAQPCPRNPGSDTDCLVAILGLDQKIAAELFARLCERPVGDEHFAVAHPDADRCRRWM